MIFQYSDYREYLKAKLGQSGTRTGLRSRLAKSIGVHTTFVSQVFKEKSELSMEQAEAVNEFLEHSEIEGEYFLYLVMLERAGTLALRKRLESKIESIRESHMRVKERIKPQHKINESDRMRFYSNHYYGAIHVLVSIPEFQSVEALSKSLRLERSMIQEMVDFMIGIGVLVYDPKKDQLSHGSNHIHLSNDDELILRHHTNWRVHTIENLHFLKKDDLHYSACVSLSQKDAYKIKDLLLNSLKENVDIISKSKEETAYVYNIDFYKL